MITKKELGFSITTNATLMTQNIAEYFFKEGFGVRISIDGPQEIHDEYRKDINGKGSFQRTISGLKMLYDVYADKKEKIGLSMVLAPPFSKEKMDQVTELWNEYLWLSRNIEVALSYSQGFFPSVISDDKKHDRNFTIFDWAGKEFIEKYQTGIPAHTIAKSVVERHMVQIVQRHVYSGPLKKYSLNGCCIPASRKQFVTVDGKLLLCERIGMAPEIGNVDTGIDVEKCKNIYIKQYAEESLPYCSRCWALQLCSICYLHAYSDGRIDIQMKNRNCIAVREQIEKHLSLYCRLLEINENGLDYLWEWETE